MSDRRGSGGWGRMWAAVMAALLLAGCSLSTPYPGRSLYTVTAGAPAEADMVPSASRKDLVLRVRKLVAMPPYNTTSFIYKTGENAVKPDYYNLFAAAPAELLTAELVQWLSATHGFKTVTDGGSGAAHRWVLEGRLQELSIDTSKPAKPEAVLTVQVLVWDESEATGWLLMEKGYTERTAIAGMAAGDAAAGWSKGCRALFGRVAKDLGAVTGG